MNTPVIIATFRVVPDRVASDGDEKMALVATTPVLLGRFCLDEAKELWAAGAYDVVVRSGDNCDPNAVRWTWSES